ncbi:MAG: hypothetical protein RRY36_07960 [Bacteroidaceae bacterium]
MKAEDLIELIELIESLPDSDKHIYTDEDGITVTSEWLVGNFAGVGFVANTKEEAAKQLIGYLDRHITHDSMVGDIVRKSGYPDLKRMKEYCLMELDRNRQTNEDKRTDKI